jgi:hypothetical protein
LAVGFVERSDAFSPGTFCKDQMVGVGNNKAFACLQGKHAKERSVNGLARLIGSKVSMISHR